VHDRTGQHAPIEQQMAIDAFPTPAELWQRYCAWKGIAAPKSGSRSRRPTTTTAVARRARYYQLNAINRTVEAIAGGQNRVLLVMATGTGKTYTAFQIIWRLWQVESQKTHPFPRRPRHPR
jgi:type I restriction enzyme R subunit